MVQDWKCYARLTGWGILPNRWWALSRSPLVLVHSKAEWRVGGFVVQLCMGKQEYEYELGSKRLVVKNGCDEG